MTESAEPMEKAVKAIADREGKYLTFSLADEDYGIGILKIREIIGMMSITAVPQTPDFVKGVINLRGKVISVVDLRLRFGMEKIDYTDRTCIIVIETQTSYLAKCWEVKNCAKKECPAYKSRDLRCWIVSGNFCRDEIQDSFHEKIEACHNCDVYKQVQKHKSMLTMGIVVDAVSEVLNIKADEIEDTPTFGTKLDTAYILGMAKLEGGVKILLDIDKVLSSDTLVLLEEAA